MLKVNFNRSLSAWLSLLLLVMLISEPLAALAKFKPPNRGVPGRREGGGTRDGCLASKLPAPLAPIAVLPDLKKPNQVAVGQTVAAYPRFFWYLPATRGDVEFTLYADETDASEAIIYQSRFKLDRAMGQPSKAGIYSLALPANANLSPLEVGKVYHWSVAVLCPGTAKNRIEIDGGIERVALNNALQNQLKNTQPGERANFYAENGLWFDALDELAGRGCSSSNVSLTWQKLMQDPSVNLGKLADLPPSSSCGQ